MLTSVASHTCFRRFTPLLSAALAFAGWGLVSQVAATPTAGAATTAKVTKVPTDLGNKVLTTVTSPSLPGASSLIFNGDMETNNLSQWPLVQQCAAGRITTYSATSQPGYPAPTQGTYAARFHVLPTDVAPCTPTANPRAQVASGTILAAGSQYWEAFDVYFPATFPSEPVGGWYLFQEDYGSPWNGSPPLGFNISNIGGVQKLTVSRGAQYNYDVIWSAPLVRGQWYRFLVHKRFAKDSSGFIEFWVNGAPQTFADGSLRRATQTMHSDATGNYQSFINSYAKAGQWSVPVDTYFDHVKVGTTEASVQ